MTAFPSAVEATLGGALLRGMPTRTTDLMEAFQIGTIGAIAAAGGCKISSWSVDDGIDVTLTHTLNGHRVPLDIQLKSTTNGWNTSRSAISVQMRRKRYDELRSLNTGIPAILIVMDLPANQDDWAEVTPPVTTLRHALYWSSLRGNSPHPGDGEKVTVSVPNARVFDDHILCQIMARIRAGGQP
ncbi:DUF4365 domain-containing protein [uncultured Microbacterium sp.]|uniref:DUF4365 domain-containing protein n=1 Tax=uncultured Microbacterium sp. TaxID=191216 RepID=UPI00260B2AA3|nr:DUF4365 domain-containing protein [uncultured Microbacterium sp.]